MGIANSSTKSVDINASVDVVFNFLVDPVNWPQYAVVNLRSVSLLKGGIFKAITKFGEGEIQIFPKRELGILDHTWKDAQASWKVHSRVIPNGSGATFMMTFYQPPVMNNEQFAHAMMEMDVEFNKLKEILEKQGQ